MFVIDDESAEIYRGFNCVSREDAAAMLASQTVHRPAAGYVKYNMTSPHGYVSDPNWHTPSWLWHAEVRELTAAVSSSPEWHVLLDLLRSIEEHVPSARSRIVFWFSS